MRSRLIGRPGCGFKMPFERSFTAIAFVCLLSIQAFGQGETTSAIQGQATDSTGAVVSGATVTVTSLDTGSKRSAKTDGAGRFNFPQLKPGAYKVEIETRGFEPKTANNVFSGLGQKQTVNFTLKVAHSNQTIEVSSQAPIINPSNANTSTTLAAPALEAGRVQEKSQSKLKLRFRGLEAPWRDCINHPAFPATERVGLCWRGL
jgi:hypothetical protein